jgi:hypothetical protein
MLSPLKLTIYGTGDEIKKEVTRSIVPWGVLEAAIDLQDEFEDLKDMQVDDKGNPIIEDGQAFKAKIKKLTEFIIFVFDDAVTEKEIKQGASIKDMFGLYRQIFAMVSEVMPKNPTQAPANQKAALQQVRQGRKSKKK